MCASEHSSKEAIVRNMIMELVPERTADNIDCIPLSHLGIDSMDFYEVLVRLDEEHGIAVPMQKLSNALTLQDIYRVL